MPKVLFTTANAREMSAKAHAAKAAIRQAELARLALIDDLLAKAAIAPAMPIASPEAEAYLSRRLDRIRAQLDLIDTRIEEEAKKKPCDGQLLNWLCSAQERLAEQERVTAGRPGPGTLKPKPIDSPPAKPAARQLPIPRPPAMPPPAGPPAPPSSSPPQLPEQEEPPPKPKPWLSEPPDY